VRRATRSWLRAIGLAAITGSRTALGPALVFGRARRRKLRAGPLALAALELFADKLPRMPYRTAPLGLAFRIVSAAAVVRAVLRRHGRAVGAGALAAGAAAAVAGAFIGLRLRLAMTRRLGGGVLSNALAGAVEDAALIGVGRRLAAAR
jgi:uncharacterized membrane protein